MATDYDTPRKTDDDVDSDSLEELKARRNDKSTSAVDVDEFEAAEGPADGPHGARDDERGSSEQGSASLEPAADRVDLPVPADVPAAAPVAKRRAAAIRDKAREGVRKGGSRARAGLAYLADRII